MDELPETFTVAVTSGVTLTRWTRAWQERQRRIPLAFLPTDAASQVSVLHRRLADVSFVRLPIDRAGLSVIPLYDEVPVVIVPTGHPISMFESVTVADLAGDGRVDAGLAAADAVELVAAGGGILILPQSIARLHGRKDVVARPVTDAPVTSIALAWVAERTTPQIDEFVGIVRGRTAASSRSAAPTNTPPPKSTLTKSERPSRAPAPKTRASQRARSRKSRGR
ncbi:MAG: LysR substrate-binding domain-containing protein [Actinomycetota bacterium]